MSSLLRSTKFLRYFTGSTRTLVQLNSAKRNEVKTILNSAALCGSNTFSVKNYATKTRTDYLESLLQTMNSDVLKHGRITQQKINEVFDEMQATKHLKSTQLLLFIRCCGELVPEELPEQRTLLLKKLLSTIEERGIPMDISHYNAVLKVYLENEHPFSPGQFLEEMEKKGIEPNRVTYQRLMWRYCQEGDMEGATNVLEKMKELNMPVSEPVLNALVMGRAFHGDIDGAKAVLETMLGAGLQPTSHTYSLLACGYAKNGDIDGIEEVISTANNKDAVMTDKDILNIIEKLTVCGHGDKIKRLFHHLQKSAGYNQEVSNFILRLINKGHESTAKEIMTTMRAAQNMEDNLYKGAFFVKQLVKSKPVESVIKICRELKEEEVVPNAFVIATEEALLLGHTELAQRLFTELKSDGMEVRPHYYWPLLAQKAKQNDEEGMLQIIKHMTSESIFPSDEAIREYVFPYLRKKYSPDNIIYKLRMAYVPETFTAKNLMTILLAEGKIKDAADVAVKFRPRVQISQISHLLLKSFKRTKDIDAFVSILHVISSTSPQSAQTEEDSNPDEQSDINNGNEVGEIVKLAIANLSQPELCKEMLVSLYNKGIKISTESAEAISQLLGAQMDETLSEVLTQLTSADLEPMPLKYVRRKLLSDKSTSEEIESMVKTGNNNILQKQLLMCYIRENKVEKVKSYVKELESSNFELSPSLMANIFEFYCQNDEISLAFDIKDKIFSKHPTFKMGKYRLIMMAYALLRANQYDEAMKFLNENKSSYFDPEAPINMRRRKVIEMLNFLTEQKEANKVKEFTEYFINNDYIETDKDILAPSIKVHLLKEDIDAALQEFEHCVKQYRCTPLNLELMKRLIMKEDVSKLQWLADLNTQVHGEFNAVYDLAFAFLECGRIGQARRVLQTPGLIIKKKRLDDLSEYYAAQGNSEHLENLLEATKELPNIDRSGMFYNLLKTYCDADETDKALGLWTLLQEEGEIPSDQFLKYLGNHLKMKNREVPFIVPETSEDNVIEENIAVENNNSDKVNKISDEIVKLLDNGQFIQAADYCLESMKKEMRPKFNAIKILLKRLSNAGEVDKIQQLGINLSKNMKNRTFYDRYLISAIFIRGGEEVSKYLNELLKNVEDEKNINELRWFPRFRGLEKIVDNEEDMLKCHKLAEIASSKGIYEPANSLWNIYIATGKYEEANNIWNKWLINSDKDLSLGAMHECIRKKQPHHVEKIISTLQTNPNTGKSVIQICSRLINTYLTDNDLETAKSLLQMAHRHGIYLEDLADHVQKSLKQFGEEFVQQAQ